MIKTKTISFPFSAVIGQDDFKLALILNLIDPMIGGVLAIGDKGTGKTTLIRSLAQLMAQIGNFPFVNLPLGASEDRVLGHVDLEKLINEKREHITSGLLSLAHEGVLYIDEVNILSDYLTDILLDASASGGYYLERDGLAHYFKSRFCLVGSMNPEEGDLRPQLKDRFGLSITISTPTDINTRKTVIQSRLAFDDDPEAFLEKFANEEQELANQIQNAQHHLKSIIIPEIIITKSAELAAQNHVEGLRADILLIRSARAYAAFQKAEVVHEEHLHKIAPFVLNHRRQSPPQNPSFNPPNQEQPEQQQEDSATEQNINHQFKPLNPKNNFQKTKTTNDQQSQIISSSKAAITKVDIKQSVGQYLATDQFELKKTQDKKSQTQHHIFLIDSSGSMLANNLVAYAKGAIQKLSTQNKSQTTCFSIISLFNGRAETILTQNKIVKQVDEALNHIKTGGKTNIVAGFKQVKSMVTNLNSSNHLHLITDGRFNEGGNLNDAILAFRAYCKAIAKIRIIDAEQGHLKLGFAHQLAQKLNADYELLLIDNN